MPQIIMIFWLTASFINSFVKSGESKSVSFSWSIASAVLEIILYTWGGFFSESGLPQAFMVVIIGGAVVYSAAHHGEVIGTYSPAANLISAALLVALLNWGGFWVGAF